MKQSEWTKAYDTILNHLKENEKTYNACAGKMAECIVLSFEKDGYRWPDMGKQAWKASENFLDFLISQLREGK